MPSDSQESLLTTVAALGLRSDLSDEVRGFLRANAPPVGGPYLGSDGSRLLATGSQRESFQLQSRLAAK